MLTGIAIAAAAGYLLFVAVVFFAQPRLVYLPDLGRELGATPQSLGLAFENLELATADGERLQAWWIPRDGARGAAIVFHGNAGNISHRIDYAAMFHRLGYATLLVDYRGFGRSTGSPSEEGTYRDAEAAWRHVTGTRGFAPGQVVLLGESLGGGVATWLAMRARPRAVVLAGVFTSVPDIGAEIYPFLPVRLLARIRYPVAGNLAHIDAPVLVAHSPADEIIPFAHGERLYAAAREPKVFLELAGGHNDGLIFMQPQWVAALERFLVEAERLPAAGGSGAR
jgi:fermentation-respiration switch protein FrsA (DUF1100 family)